MKELEIFNSYLQMGYVPVPQGSFQEQKELEHDEVKNIIKTSNLIVIKFSFTNNGPGIWY